MGNEKWEMGRGKREKEPHKIFKVKEK